MFIHGRTGKVYYSIREKINYYKKRLNDKSLSNEERAYAEKRLRDLKLLNSRSFSEPEYVVTNDKHFGNSISKPRLCVVIDKDDKDRLLVASVNPRTTNAIILDNDFSRQIDERKVWISSSEVYENDYIDDIKPLTRYDKGKISSIIRKKR